MAVRPEPAPILSFEDARHIVEAHGAELPEPAIERVELLMAAGRVLAEPGLADRDIPPFPRSTRDGYAVRSAALTKLPATLEIISQIRGGQKAPIIPTRVAPGQV